MRGCSGKTLPNSAFGGNCSVARCAFCFSDFPNCPLGHGNSIALKSQPLSHHKFSIIKSTDHLYPRRRRRRTGLPITACVEISAFRSLLRNVHCKRHCTTSSLPAVYDPSTFLVSSSLPNSPRFRICPAVGVSARPCVSSAFLYAACIAMARAACEFVCTLAKCHHASSPWPLSVQTNLFLVVEALIVVL